MIENIAVQAPVSQVASVPAPVEPVTIQPHVIWSGFMTRNKTRKVGIDLSLVKGEEDLIPASIYHLNITHRVKLSEISKYEVLSLVLFEPSNETQ